MTRLLLILVAVVCGLAVACDSGNPVAPDMPVPDTSTFTVVVTADPSTLEAGSDETSTVTVAVTRRSDNQTPDDGTGVSLSTNLGSFGSDDQGAILVTTLSLVSGRAQATLFAAADTGTANLLAQVGDSLGETTVTMEAAAAPTLVSVTPNIGLQAGGEEVLIEGEEFKEPLRVSFSTSSAQVVEVVSQRQIRVLTPPSPSSLSSGETLAVDVTVTTRLNQEEALSATLTGGFIYTAGDVPPFFLTGVSPGTGRPEGGDRVLVEGGGFREPLRVTFDGTLAEVVSVAPRRIRVVTPETATTVNPGERLQVDVVVTNAVDESEPQSETLIGGFIYENNVAELFLTEVLPNRGGPGGGESVRVRGGGFIRPVRVDFDGIPGLGAEVRSSREIIVGVPAPATPVAAGATLTVAVTVTNDLDDGGTISATLDSAYTYVGGELFVTEVVPPSGGAQGGETVTLVGGGFRAPVQVDFGTQPAAMATVLAPDAVRVVVPAPATPVGAGQTLAVDVTVTNDLNSGGSSTAMLTNAYTYNGGELFVTEVVPSSGGAEGGETLSVLGGGFRGTVQVDFGTQPAAMATVISPSEIRVAVPAPATVVGGGTTQTVDVTVINDLGSGGTSTATLANAYSYVGELFVTEVVPPSGGALGGETVRILGGGFLSPARVDFGTQPAAMATVVSSTEISVVVPAPASPIGAGQSQAVDVTVSNDLAGGGVASATLTNGYTYVSDDLFLTEVVPNIGGAEGGEVVSLRGGGFIAPVQVTFGTQPAIDPAVVSKDEISVVVPAPAATVNPGETSIVAVTVTNDLNGSGSSVTLDSAYTYNGGTVPELFSVVPNFGPNEGGTEVTLTGSGFEDPVDVLIGGFTSSDVTFVSPTEVVAVTPRASSSNRDMTVDVTVRNRNSGLEATLAGGFTYSEEIVITALEPARGIYTGGDVILVRGSGFISPVSVELDGVPQLSETVLDSSRVEFVTEDVSVSECPAGGEITTSTVTVTNLSSGNSGSASLTFTYEVPLPRISSVSPNAGDQVGGDSVTISGSDFESPVRVTFVKNNVEFAATLSSTSTTSVSVTSPEVPNSSLDEEACDSGTGFQYLNTAFDVKIENLTTGCSDTLPNAFTYTPTDTSCRTTSP